MCYNYFMNTKNTLPETKPLTNLLLPAVTILALVWVPFGFSGHYTKISEGVANSGIEVTAKNLGLEDSNSGFTPEQLNVIAHDLSLAVDEINISEEETFALNSRPGAPITFYLDFNGAELQNTGWNISSGKSTLIYPPFTIDENDSFNSDELKIFYLTWAKISETFKQFDVNVTTQTPNPADIIRLNAEDTRYGIHAIFTQHVLDGLEDCGCGGIAYISTFGNVDPTATPSPVFINPEVFGESYFDFNNLEFGAGILSHIAIHEIGHALGLHHHGAKEGQEYAPAVGTLGFYMGATPPYSVYKRWSDASAIVESEVFNGSGVNHHQDDLTKLYNILPLAITEDDYPNTLREAKQQSTAISVGEKISGFMDSHNDVDIITLSVLKDGVYRIAGAPTEHNHQLALTVQIFTSSGEYIDDVVLNDSGRALKLRATMDYSQEEVYTFLGKGTYYVKLTPSHGNYWGEGQENIYGSMGSWTLDVSGFDSAKYNNSSETNPRTLYNVLSGGIYGVQPIKD